MANGFRTPRSFLRGETVNIDTGSLEQDLYKVSLATDIIDARAFGGTEDINIGPTKEQMITAAIQYAASVGASKVLIPKSMTGFNSASITTNPNVQLIQEGFGVDVTFNVRDFKVATDPDDTLAFQRVIAAAKAYGGNGARIEWTGNLNISDTLVIDTHRIHIWGQGLFASSITFNPTSAKVLFKVQNSNNALIIFQGSFGNFELIGAGTQQKIGFDMYDFSAFVLFKITHSGWTGNSGSSATPSIALRTNGREFFYCSEYVPTADRPIQIRVNPNAPTQAESCDHFHFHNLAFATLIASETGILIDANVAVSNITFDGYQDWVAGKFGLDYVAGGTSGVTGFHARFDNVRFEQGADATGYAFRWQPQAHQNLTFNNCLWGGASNANNGTLLRNTKRVKYDTCQFLGGAGTVAHDWDGTCDTIWNINNFCQDSSTVNLGTLVEVESWPKRNSLSPIPETVYYCNPATDPIAKKLGGSRTFQYNGLIANGGNLQFPAIKSGNAPKSVNVQVSCYSATGPINECAVAMYSPTGFTFCGTAFTSNMLIGNPGAGKIGLFSGADPPRIINNSGQTLDIEVRLDWR